MLTEEKLQTLYELKAARADLESKAKEIKAAEDDLRQSILMDLEAAGLDTAKLAGWTVSRTHTVRVEVASHETLQSVMLDRMLAARADGRPLQDGMLLNRAANKNAVLALLREQLGLGDGETLSPTDERVAKAAAANGVRLVQITDLSVRHTA